MIHFPTIRISSYLLFDLITIFFVLLIMSYALFTIIRRINAPKHIEELTIFADGLKKSISQSVDIKTKNRHEKKLKKVESKIEYLKLLTTPKKSFSQAEKLCYKLKITHRLLLATIMVALIITFFAWGTYKNYSLYSESNSDLCKEISDLQVKIDDLEYKAECLDWYTNNTRLVIADDGNLNNTYHKFGCEKLYEANGIQIFMKEDVIDSPLYTKCPDCIEKNSKTR